jgi:hypothetical protein
MKYIILLVALVTGCHNLNKSQDNDVFQAVIRSWEATGMMDASGCLDDTHVQVVSDISFATVCGQTTNLSLGCFREETKNRFFSKTKVFYISEKVQQKWRDYILTQLALHAMCECTATSHNDRQDSLMFRPKVWMVNSREASVEAMAYRRLGY